MSGGQQDQRPVAKAQSLRGQVVAPLMNLFRGSEGSSAAHATRHTEESPRAAYAESSNGKLPSKEPRDSDKDAIERREAVDGSSDEIEERKDLYGYDQGMHIQDAVALIQDALVHIQDAVTQLQHAVERKEHRTPSEVEKAIRVDTNDSLAAIRTISRVPDNNTYYEKGGLRTMGDGQDHINEEPVSIASSPGNPFPNKPR